MNKEDIKIGMKVTYVPGHARGDKKHPDCEKGVVTGIGNKFDIIFIRYRDDHISKATSPEDLFK